MKRQKQVTRGAIPAPQVLQEQAQQIGHKRCLHPMSHHIDQHELRRLVRPALFHEQAITAHDLAMTGLLEKGEGDSRGHVALGHFHERHWRLLIWGRSISALILNVIVTHGGSAHKTAMARG
jgi:hypothetical protein